jgi:hypothetical protein
VVTVQGAGVVIVTESGGRTVVLPGGPLTHTYTIELATPPTATVFLTISASYGGGAPYAQISIDGGLTYADSVVLVFAAGETGPVTVTVRLNPGVLSFPPGFVVETISTSTVSADPLYNRATVRNVYVNEPLPQPLPTPPGPPAPPAPVVPAGGGAGHATATGTTGGLAATGSSIGMLPLGAALLLLLGLGLLVGVERRGRAGRAARTSGSPLP